MSFHGNSQKVLTYFLPFQKSIYETATEKPEELIKIYENVFNKGINEYNIEQFISYDKYLLNLCDTVIDENESNIAKNLCHSLSLSTLLAMSKMNNSNIIDFINSTIPLYKLNSSNIPDLGFVIFKTGKDMNSKVKFEKWILFISNVNKLSSNDLKDLFSKIYNSLKKVLTAGKAGENGMRLNDEGSYFPPIDTTNDIIKLIENVIAECGGNNLYYGIDCNGNNYYTAETQTYEMDGFKKPHDNEQMIEFFVKLCKDHPLLKYLEDPLSNEDLRGYSKLFDKFEAEGVDVQVTLKRLVDDKIGGLNHIIEEEEGKEGSTAKMNTLNPLYRSRLINNEARPEDIKEELTELEKKKKAEEEERKRLQEEEEKRRQEEEEQKRLEEEEAKNAKGGKKKPEPKKVEVKKPNVKKTEEELKKEKEEEEKLLPPPIPFTKLKEVAVNFGNFKCLTHLNDIVQKVKQKGVDLTIYDNIFESEQSMIVDVAIGLHFKRVILHGFTIKPDKMTKVVEYIENVPKIY